MSIQEPLFKVLYQNSSMYLCDLETDELDNLDNQNCWKAANTHDAGIR